MHIWASHGICSGWMGTMWALAQNGLFVWVPLGFLTLNQYGQSKVGTYSRSLLGQRWEILNLVRNGKDTFTDSLGSVGAHLVSDFPNITPISVYKIRAIMEPVYNPT